VPNCLTVCPVRHTQHQAISRTRTESTRFKYCDQNPDGGPHRIDKLHTRHTGAEQQPLIEFVHSIPSLAFCVSSSAWKRQRWSSQVCDKNEVDGVRMGRRCDTPVPARSIERRDPHACSLSSFYPLSPTSVLSPSTTTVRNPDEYFHIAARVYCVASLTVAPRGKCLYL
jgi:hypothetical protein